MSMGVLEPKDATNTGAPVIVFPCPWCRKKLQVSAGLAGRGGTCPFCGKWAVAPLQVTSMPHVGKASHVSAPPPDGDPTDPSEAGASGAFSHLHDMFKSGHALGSVAEKSHSAKHGHPPADAQVPRHSGTRQTRIFSKKIVVAALILVIGGILAWIVCCHSWHGH